ncbi:MAG: hypothetical protein AABX52_04390, partial [Nanoarchaeota archaeon]
AQEYRDFSAAWKQGLNAPKEYVGSDDPPFVKNFIVPTSYKTEDDSKPNYWEEEITDYSQIEHTILSLYEAFTGREFDENLTVYMYPQNRFEEVRKKHDQKDNVGGFLVKNLNPRDGWSFEVYLPYLPRAKAVVYAAHEILGHLPCSAMTIEDAEACTRVATMAVITLMYKYYPSLNKLPPFAALGLMPDDELHEHLLKMVKDSYDTYARENGITETELKCLVRFRNTVNQSYNKIR